MSKSLPKIVKQIQQQQLAEINYAYQRSISYSQMTIYNSCAYKWKLQYKEGITIPSFSIHTIFGTAVHEALQHYLTMLYEKSGVEADKFDIEEYFKNKFIEQYQIAYKQNNNTHFSSSQELREFHDDGLEIISWVKKHKSDYFSKRGWYLVGCEIPLIITPNKAFKNVLYKGYLDLVLYHEPTNTIKIIDIKTSTRGWSDKEKKDESKQYQLILYKEYLSKHFNIDPDHVEIEFFIVKRKIYAESDFPQKRVQIYVPPSGKIKTKKATNAVNKFIEDVFNTDGTIKDIEYKANPSDWNCKYCPFSSKKEFCDKSVF
jgi:hypothetical protein